MKIVNEKQALILAVHNERRFEHIVDLISIESMNFRDAHLCLRETIALERSNEEVEKIKTFSSRRCLYIYIKAISNVL